MDPAFGKLDPSDDWFQFQLATWIHDFPPDAWYVVIAKGLDLNPACCIEVKLEVPLLKMPCR